MWRIKKLITDKNTFQSNIFIVCLIYIINVCSNRASSHWYRVCNGRRRTWGGAKTLSGTGKHERHIKTNGDFKGVLIISKQKYSEQFYNRRNHGSKIDAENTHTRPLTFFAWYVHLNKKYLSKTSLMGPNLPS